MAKGELAEQDEAAASQPKPKRKTLLMGGVLLGVMAVEALVVVVLVKHFGAEPASVEAAPIHGLDEAEGSKQPLDKELSVVKFRAQNEKSQRMLYYDLTVYISVPEAESERVNEIVQRKQATIQDRFSSIVRSADPQRFMEPDLATLREQFKRELSQIIGDEKVIQQVLIPSVACGES